jgi:hypothetical protein
MNFIDSKALEIKKQIENDIATITADDLDIFFTESLKDKRVISFTNYYNKTVLDKERINFGEFKNQWAIQGMKKQIYQEFNSHFEARKQEILREKDIKNFFNKYCRTDRNEASFCCKLFHTILPNEFPPLDNPIRKHFKIQRIDFIESLLIVKKAYKLFISDNKDKLQLFREKLYEPKFKVFRVRELSDLRILDMYYWLKISRNKEGLN